MEKPRLRFWQIWNMSFGFLGIQFGWGLQMANMSAIYEYLGAKPDDIPILWLAAPLTGLIVQPIVGNMSDRTWTRMGRRSPYFLVGAILASLALLAMPMSSSLWMAAGLLWVLDGSVNVSMQPFRALVPDMLPEEQRTAGFSMQSLFIGLGSIVASALPWILANVFGVGAAGGGGIPATVRLAFYIGAAAFFAAVMWTIFTIREYPPEDLEAFRRAQHESRGIGNAVRDIFDAIVKMPATMRQLAWAQIFTWLGLFAMWLYFPVAVAHNVFDAPNETSPLYQQGVEWAGVCFAMYSVVTFFFAFALPRIADRLGPRLTHTLCLVAGAVGLLSVGLIHNKFLLLASMLGVGVVWSSTVSMPYAIVEGSLPPARVGVYMGIFNSFIVLPEICAALGFGWVMRTLLDNNRMAAVLCGGACFLVAAVLMQRVHEPTAEASGVASKITAPGH